MCHIYLSHAGIKKQEAIVSNHLAKKGLLGMISSVLCSTIRVKNRIISSGYQNYEFTWVLNKNKPKQTNKKKPLKKPQKNTQLNRDLLESIY